MRRSLPLAICALLAALSLSSAAQAQNGNISGVTFSSNGRPAAGVNVAVCNTFTTTAAAVASNIATLTFSSNPITAGFVSGATLTVSGFTGGDTYFNGTFTIASTSATTISYALVHANASAGTNGSVYQTGSTTQACAALASAFTDNTGNFSAPNPTVSDGLGNYTLWVAPGYYIVQNYGPTVRTSTYLTGVGCVPSTLINACNAYSGPITAPFFNATTAANAYEINGSKILFLPGDTTSLGVGSGALAVQTAPGLNNTAVGSGALGSDTTSSGNTAVGVQALTSVTTQGGAGGNTAVGFQALGAETTSSSTAVGWQALVSATSGINDALGQQALASVTTGSTNVAVGFLAGNSNGAGGSGTATTTGGQNTFLGAEAVALNSTDINSLVVGYRAVGAGSNTAVIGNVGVTDVYLGSAAAVSTIHAAAARLSVSSRAALQLADQGTACTNAEIQSGLSAGWQSTGSATVTAVAGNGQTCSWTITTGTTTAANPTVTDTLTNVLPAATTVCELNIHGGTHTPAAGEGFTQTALSATAPIFTFIGTPTAGGFTYFVTRRCGP